MADEFFYGPSIAIVGTLVILNCMYCCLGVRRIRSIEQRIHVLEERQVSIPTATATATDTPSQQMVYPYARPTTYAAPNPNYSYYQQQQQPTAPTYYPQDPQIVYR
jgi:hypothetical protein